MKTKNPEDDLLLGLGLSKILICMHKVIWFFANFVSIKKSKKWMYCFEK